MQREACVRGAAAAAVDVADAHLTAREDSDALDCGRPLMTPAAKLHSWICFMHFDWSRAERGTCVLNHSYRSLSGCLCV